MDYIDKLTSKLDKKLAEMALRIQSSNLPDDIKEIVALWNPSLSVKIIEVQLLKECLNDFFEHKRYSGNPFYDDLISWIKWDDFKRGEKDNLRVKTLGHRKELYRITAKQLAEQYSIVAIGDLNLAKLARLRNAGTVNNQRVRANLHNLKDAIIHACNKSGAETILITDNYSQVHNDCGNKLVTKNQTDVLLHCEHCHTDFDRDINASLNLLDCVI